MSADHTSAKRAHPFAWIGWLLAVVFAAASAGLAHHMTWMRSQLDLAEGDASQLRLQLGHAEQIVAVLTSPEATHVVLSGSRQAAQPVGQVSWLSSRGALVFVAGGLRPLPAGKAYELWLVPAQGKAPIPAGVFHPDADRGATLVLPPLPAETQARLFMVTVEPAQGSATPSLPIVMQGE
jgi:anti-sigma-K factor RskA